MATQGIVVSSGGYAAVHGTASNLLVERDGEVDVYGTVNGVASNEGGVLRIYGTINGQLIGRQDSGTKIFKGAVIKP